MKSVLFIQLSRMGDSLQSTPLLASWHRRFPDDRIVVLVRMENSVIFERNPDVAETIVFNPPVPDFSSEAMDPVERLAALQKWIGPLKERNFRAVVNLTHDSLSSWVTTGLGTHETRGLFFDRSGRKCIRDPWGLYTFSMLKFRRANLFNIADSYAHLSGGASVVSAPVFPLDPESVGFANEQLSGVGSDDCIIGFQPGANLEERRWPVENFIRIGQSLSSDGFRVVVFGAKNEEGLGRAIAENVPGAINFAGKTTIPQLAALLARCTLLVTNDTGTMHLGTAVGTRILALFESSAYFRETGPYGTGHWIIQSPEILEYGEKTAEELAGIRRIPTEEVLWAARVLAGEVLGRKFGRVDVPGEVRAQHFRSMWEAGHLDFYPERPTPLGQEILCGYLERPIWLATLDGFELPVEKTAAEVLEYLGSHYGVDAGYKDQIIGIQEEVRACSYELGRMKKRLQSAVEKLRRNPKYLVPQDDIAELKRLEESLLKKESVFSLHAFLGYFEIGLAMVGGNTTREYLEQYLRPVMMLERQLGLLGRLLSALKGIP